MSARTPSAEGVGAGPCDSEDVAALCRDILDLVGSKWSVMVVGRLDLEGTHRFGELEKAIPGITPKSLTNTLRRLERDGLVRRTVLTERRPPQVEYALTDLGWTVTEPLRAIGAWAAEHANDVVSAREEFDTRHSEAG